MKNNLSESLLVEAWRQLLDSDSLVTEEGEPFRVIYPGRVNDDRGADLRDTIISTRQGLIKGDVEFHIKSSNWQAHHHHQDPAYNRVILHVVFEQDSTGAISLQSGKKVPTLVLPRYVSRWPSPVAASTPCQTGDNEGLYGEFLDRMGEERFLTKASGFQKELGQTGAAQVLYQGIMGALGYARNKSPCLELARRVPLEELRSTLDSASDEECLARQQSRLLGTAGLLPSQRSGWRQPRGDDAWLNRLEDFWASARRARVMSEKDWHLFRVRPSNSPQRRIAAMSYLLLRYRKRGILSGLITKARELPADSGKLEETIKVGAEGYWSTHYDFSLPVPEVALVGEGRAAEIVINVLLPFASAWGKLNDDLKLSGKAIELYRSFPSLAMNTIEKHMRRQLGLGKGLVNSARRQQGLLHIYQTGCSQGKCRSCPVNRGFL